ncbi:MAG: type II secretion system secretin GspD [Planctomycetota bacterium]
MPKSSIRSFVMGAFFSLILAMPMGVSPKAAAQSAPETGGAPTGTSEPTAAQAGPTSAGGGGSLVMHFRDVPLQSVLNYLSDEAGLIVVSEIDLNGDRITVFNLKPVTLDEAIAMLNTVLFEKGFTAVRRERLLKIVILSDAKTQSIPVRFGNDPSKIGETDSLITQVIPIRYAEAVGMTDNLKPLISGEYAELSANESSNSLILTDTEANVRRIVEIVSALDQSISQVSEVRVFRLAFADAESVAELLETTFATGPTEDEIVAQAMSRRFGGRGRGGEEPEGSGTPQSRDVNAAADERTNSVVVAAGPDIMLSIAAIIEELDVDTTAKESVLIYAPKNMQAADLAETFNSLFLGVSSGDDEGIGNTRTGGGASGGDLPNVTGVRTATAGSDRNRANRAPNAGLNRGAATAALLATGDAEAADLVGQVSSVADESTNTLLVLTQEKNFAKVKEILAELDREVPQVLVRVLISEITYDDTIDVGVEFETLNVGTTTDDNLLSNFNLFESTLGLNYLFFDNNDFRLAVRALQATGRFDVLSRPYILTNDNQEANITVGQEVPFPVNTRTLDDGDTISDVDYRDVGIILTVTPQINSEGLVVLNLAQELSALTDTTIPISDDFDAVVVNTRSLETQVAVADGQTVVIGGLIQDSLNEVVTKVPLVGDLPIIGNLFRRTESTKVKTELLVFLTPEVISEPGELEATSQRIKDRAESLENAVEDGMLQKHLDDLKYESGQLDEPVTEPQTDTERSLQHLGETLD